MPGAVSGAIDAPLEVFGGLITQFAPSDLPLGASPNCQNVEFSPGRVFTRAGLQSIFTPIATNPTVNYLKTYITSNELLRTLILDAVGNLWKEDATAAPGVLTNITAGILPTTFGKSTTLFGREYIAFNDGKLGRDIPRQFDDTNLDRLSCCGPGRAPTAQDNPATINVLAASQEAAANVTFAEELVPNVDLLFLATPIHMSARARLTIAGVVVAGYNLTNTPPYSQVASAPVFTTTAPEYPNLITPLAPAGAGGTCSTSYTTIQTATPHGMKIGQSVIVAGVGAGYNGTWQIEDIPDATHITFFTATTGLGALGAGGTIVLSGNISAGVHQVTVMFLNREGYLTAPAPPFSWTAAGAQQVLVSAIPIGPPNIVARVLAFTLAGGQSFFYLNGGVPQIPFSNMVIQDNTTTSAVIDFSDTVLAAGTNVDNQFSLIYLGETAGVVNYNERLFTWGGANKIDNALNLNFDGGFTSNGVGFYPLGWGPDPTQFAGGGKSVDPLIGDSYSITGDGATAVRGFIEQAFFQDFRNVPILQPNTQYQVSVRLKATGAAFTQGTFHIEFVFNGGSVLLPGGFSVACQTVGTSSYGLFTGNVLNAINTIPSDVLLRIYIDGTPNNGAILNIDELEIIPVNQAFQSSTLDVSYADQAESFNGVSGLMQVAVFNGQAVRSCFVLRDNIYFVKERSLFFSKDDATNEPALWPVNPVSQRVGTPSINGVGYGEDWVVIASRDGAYLFDGREPTKISQEIQPTWDSINWQFGHTIWVEVDTKRKRVLFGVPIGEANRPNTVLMLDYSYLNSGAEIIDYPSVHSSTYTGKNIDLDKARKWAKWTIAANSGALIERNDGTAQTWVGNGTGTGKVYQIGTAAAEGGTQTTDDGAVINSFYDTFFFLEHQLEQQLQIGSHRKLFVYLVMYVQGSGKLLLQYSPDTLSIATSLPTLTLSNPAARDTEIALNVIASRASFRIGANALQRNGAGAVSGGDWFVLEKFVPTLKRHDWADVRGSAL